MINLLVKQKLALKYLIFMKENIDGTVKARGCASVRPQREYTNKEDASSPTMSLKAMLISCRIESKEGRYVVMTNFPEYKWYLKEPLQSFL
jgi:hypothetical protein